MNKLGVIGVGQMAGAIIDGGLKSGKILPTDLGLYDIESEKLEKYRERGAHIYKSIEAVVENSGVILLSVKPQNFADVLPLVKNALTPEKIIVSIAAGIDGEQIRKAVGFDCKVVLAMPNTPLLIGEGATGIARLSGVTDEEFALVKSIFASVGLVKELPPEQLTLVIPISGSTPAFIYEFARIIIDYATLHGVDSETAKQLVAQTLVGSGKMLLETGKSPEELIKMVSSPGGTTVAGMKALGEKGYNNAIAAACEACVVRAKELSLGADEGKPSEVLVKRVVYESPEYKELLKLREAVMRRPLGLRLEGEDIALDNIALHFGGFAQGQGVGSAMLIPVDNGVYKVRQVAVDFPFQGKGIGRKLMEFIAEAARENGYTKLVLSARDSAVPFYLSLGYHTVGEPFTEVGIAHIEMEKELS